MRENFTTNIQLYIIFWGGLLIWIFVVNFDSLWLFFMIFMWGWILEGIREGKKDNKSYIEGFIWVLFYVIKICGTSSFKGDFVNRSRRVFNGKKGLKFYHKLYSLNHIKFPIKISSISFPTLKLQFFLLSYFPIKTCVSTYLENKKVYKNIRPFLRLFKKKNFQFQYKL